MLSSQSMSAQFDELVLIPTRETTINTEEGTFMNLDISPVNGDIVFQLLGNIFLLPENKSEAIQLTRGMAWDSYPVFSPDGERIAFISDRSGKDLVYTIKTDGSEMKKIKGSNSEEPILSLSWIEEGKSMFDDFYSYVIKTKEKKILNNQKSKIKFNLEQNKIIRYDETKDQSSIIHVLPENYVTSKFQVSPDGKYLAYVTLNSLMDKEFIDNKLCLINVTTGELMYKVAIGKYLKHFPNFGFSGNSDKLIIPYDGKIHSIDLKSYENSVIPFQAAIEMELAPRILHKFPLHNDSLKVTRFRWTQPYKKGLVFSSLGKLYNYKNGIIENLLNTDFDQYFPEMSNLKDELFFTSWNKENEGFIWKMNKDGSIEKVVEDSALYKYPTISNKDKYLAYIKVNRKSTRFLEGGENGTLYLKDLQCKNGNIFEREVPIMNSISFNKDQTEIRFIEAHKLGNFYRRYISSNIHTGNKSPIAEIHHQIKKLILNTSETYLSFVYHHNLYLLDLKDKTRPYALIFEDDLKKAVQLTFEGVTDPIFLNDNTLAWSQGPFYHELIIKEDLFKKKSRDWISEHQKTISLNQYTKVKIAGNLKAFTGARIITMNGDDQVIEKGTILICKDRIEQVGDVSEVIIPENAEIFNLKGKTILPGFIEVHGHDGPPDDVLASNWNRFLINFAYGITTIRDPSVNADYYSYSQLSETGKLIAPRLFGVPVLMNNEFEIGSLQDAKDWVQMQKRLGTKYIKVHDSWNRLQRQFLVQAANDQKLNIVGHADSENYAARFNLSILLDGFTSWEHIIPFGKMYSDARKLISFSNTWYTMTGISMGGEFNQLKNNIFKGKVSEMNLCQVDIFKKYFKNENYQIIPQESLYRPYITDASSIFKEGGNIPVGSHGDMPGLEFHWEMWSFNEGGMTSLQALRAGTIEGARLLGMQEDLGSLEPGKIADMVIFNENPLDNFKQTININGVMKNGLLFTKSQLLEICEKQSKNIIQKNKELVTLYKAP